MIRLLGSRRVTNESSYRDVQHVVAEAAPVGPASGNDSADVERMTGNQLWKHIGLPKMLRREKPGSSGFVGCAEAAAGKARALASRGPP